MENQLVAIKDIRKTDRKPQGYPADGVAETYMFVFFIRQRGLLSPRHVENAERTSQPWVMPAFIRPGYCHDPDKEMVAGVTGNYLYSVDNATRDEDKDKTNTQASHE